MIQFEGLQNVHHCTSYRLGDTIIWKCPLCIGYERRYNLRTTEMVVKGKNQFNHTGWSDKKENLESLTHNISKQ